MSDDAGALSTDHRAATGVGRGAALMVLFKLIERGIGFVSVMILARLLTPADFGLVAMAMSVVALIELMSAFGFDSALIQRRDAHRSHFDTVWTFNILFGLVSAAMLVVMAYPAAHFYNEPRLAAILPILAFGALVQGFENVGTVMFRKGLNFKQEFTYLLSKKLVGFCVTVTLAFALRNFWALIAGVIAGKLCSVAISYRIHPYRPRFSMAARADLFGFSKWVLFSNLLLFLQEHLDKFILGRTIGARNLGIFSIASEIAALPSTALIAPINRAVYPVYAKMSDNMAELNAKFLEVIGTISLIAFPAALGLACLAEPAIRLMLGPQWTDAIPLMELFVVVGLVSSLQSNLYSMIMVLGHPRANTLMSAGMLIPYMPAVYFASMHYGALGAAWAHLAMALIGLVPLFFVFFRLTRWDPLPFVGLLWRPFLASAVALLTLRLTILSPASHWYVAGNALQIAAGIVLGGSIYLLVLMSAWTASGSPEKTAESALVVALRSRLRPV